jgi:signal peptidase II
MEHREDGGHDAAARRLELALAALLVFGVDAAAKIVIGARLADGREIPLVDGLLSLRPGENGGAIFGLLPGAGPLLVAAALATSLVLLVLHERTSRSVGVSLAFGAVVGGALGNLVDRLADGTVLDFIDLGYDGLRIPLFNLADAAIVLGLLAIALAGRRPPSQEPPAA